MTFSCHGDTHVYLVGQPYCTCGGQIAVWGTCPICDQPESEHIVYPNGDTQCPPMAAASPPAMGWFGTGYAPPGYKPAKPKVDEDVPLGRFQAARRAGASHLSPDGKKAFVIRFGECHQTNWDGNEWGSWWAMGGSIVPPDAVAIE